MKISAKQLIAIGLSALFAFAIVDRQLLCPIYRQLDWPFFLFCRSIFSSAVFRL